LTAWRRGFEANGITMRQHIVLKVPHDRLKVPPQVQDFFLGVLNARRRP
jgi:hypothetical protein